MVRKCLVLTVLASFVLIQTPLALAEDFDVAAAKALFETKCSRCHPTSRPLSKQKDKDGWAMTIKRMQGKIPDWISDEQAATLIQYLGQFQGK